MDAAATESTLVMAMASLERDPGAPEPRPRDVVLEAALLWAGDVLAIEHVEPRAVVRVADLRLPPLPRGDMIVARIERGRATLVLPSGEPVPEGCRMTVRLGRASLRLSLVARDRDLAFPRAGGDGRVARGVALAAALHASIAVLAWQGRAGVGDEDDAAREAMQAYLAAADARGKVSVLADAPEERGGAAAPAKDDQGAAGNPARTDDRGRRRETRGVSRRAKTSGADEPSAFGLLALLADEDHGGGAGSSSWATADGPAAMGNIFGATVDDAMGTGGLGLSGAGQGGGGMGEGVGLGELGGFGTCGSGCMGMLRGTHVVRSPTIRCGVVEGRDTCATQVTGRLPPEAVQRAVRANFGRLRACYEAGLLRDPGLEGRIAVKFVIDRAGAVALASAEERSLPDGSVAACVARAFSQMTFPEPEGGIVTVVYPVVFSTSP